MQSIIIGAEAPPGFDRSAVIITNNGPVGRKPDPVIEDLVVALLEVSAGGFVDACQAEYTDALERAPKAHYKEHPEQLPMLAMFVHATPSFILERGCVQLQLRSDKLIRAAYAPKGQHNWPPAMLAARIRGIKSKRLGKSWDDAIAQAVAGDDSPLLSHGVQLVRIPNLGILDAPRGYLLTELSKANALEQYLRSLAEPSPTVPEGGES